MYIIKTELAKVTIFTIITATYNAAATLPRLLDSLAEQTCRDFELIIQDGASTDDTVAIAESYRDKLPSLSLVSEPDTGIYDAWNKALDRRAGQLGRWVFFLGADDKLTNCYVLQQVADSLLTVNNGIDFVSCDLIKISQFHNDIFYFKLASNPVKVLRVGMPCGHPALFQRSNIFLTTRFFTTLKIAGDYDFLIRTLKNNSNITRFNICAVTMSGDGISSSPQTKDLLQYENTVIWKKYFYFSYITRTALVSTKTFIKTLAKKNILIQKLLSIAKKQ